MVAQWQCRRCAIRNSPVVERNSSSEISRCLDAFRVLSVWMELSSEIPRRQRQCSGVSEQSTVISHALVDDSGHRHISMLYIVADVMRRNQEGQRHNSKPATVVIQPTR